MYTGNSQPQNAKRLSAWMRQQKEDVSTSTVYLLYWSENSMNDRQYEKFQHKEVLLFVYVIFLPLQEDSHPAQTFHTVWASLAQMQSDSLLYSVVAVAALDRGYSRFLTYLEV